MNKEVEKQIEEISSSAIEFRKSIDTIIFNRLKNFFKSEGKEISRESKIKVLLGKHFTAHDWYQLENIGLRIPNLKRHKAFTYVTAVYVVVSVITWTVFFLTNLDEVFAVWSLPFGFIAIVLSTLTISPILGFMAIFKKTRLPVDDIDKLVDRIIAENWFDLLTDDKRLFKEILRQELTSGKTDRTIDNYC
jgi:hypothetical protein